MVHVTANETTDIIDLSSNLVEIANDKSSTTLIQGKDGSLVPITSVLKEGSLSNRCRERMSKKKSVRKDVTVHKGHGNKKPGMMMSKAQLSNWIEKKYSMKGISGLNKRGHGFVLVNGGLYCNLCNKTVPDKPNQHLVGKKHLENYKSRKKLQRDQVLGSTKLTMETCTSSIDVEEVMINSAVRDF